MATNLTTPGIHHCPDQFPNQFPWLVNLDIYDNDRILRNDDVYIWLSKNIEIKDWLSYANGKIWKFKHREDAVLFYMTWL